MTAALIDAPARVYPECRWCHRPMRGRWQRAIDHPGTVTKRSDGLCSGCGSRAAAGLDGPAARDPFIPRENLLEDADWLTRPGNFVDTPQSIAHRLGYNQLGHLYVALRRAGAEHIAERIIQRVAEG